LNHHNRRSSNHQNQQVSVQDLELELVSVRDLELGLALAQDLELGLVSVLEDMQEAWCQQVQT
jgi:hypothetical protein